MKKLIAWIAWVLLLSIAAEALAEAPAYFEIQAQVHSSLPTLTVRVSKTGEYDETQQREWLLQVDIAAQGNGYSQTLYYRSNEDPAFDRVAAMVQLKDLNFDGYNDLVLLTAQGARNVFHTVAVWNVQNGRFDEVLQGPVWDEVNQTRSKDYTQIELCNYELIPELTGVLSCEQDGYRFRKDTLYMWEGSYGPYCLEMKGVYSVYDAGKNLIGEVLETYSTGISRYWDMQFPEDWYYGEEGRISEERRMSAYQILLSRESSYMKVANVDWVNLRQQDSKASPSLAELTAGTEVQVLAEGIGTDQGWVRVYGEAGTGYIWHSYLEPVERPQYFRKRSSDTAAAQNLTVAESVDYLEFWSDDAQSYTLEQKSVRGYTLSARFVEIADNEYRLSVTMLMPPDYMVNDSVIKYHLFVNDDTKVIGAYVTTISTSDGEYDVFYGTAHYEGKITSLRIIPQWDKMNGELLEMDAMEFPI